MTTTTPGSDISILAKTKTASSTIGADGVAAAAFDIATTESVEQRAARWVWATTRIGLAFVFLWAFVDKLFGWGIATPSERAWIHGGSPTTGFLKAVSGPLADQFHWLAGHAVVDWLFMAGLVGIGVALLVGAGMRIAAGSGVAMLVFMWAASLPIATNPFLDDHLIYAVVLVGLALIHAGDTLGIGHWWSGTKLVRRFPVLR